MVWSHLGAPCSPIPDGGAFSGVLEVPIFLCRAFHSREGSFCARHLDRLFSLFGVHLQCGLIGDSHTAPSLRSGMLPAKLSSLSEKCYLFPYGWYQFHQWGGGLLKGKVLLGHLTQAHSTLGCFQGHFFNIQFFFHFLHNNDICKPAVCCVLWDCNDVYIQLFLCVYVLSKVKGIYLYIHCLLIKPFSIIYVFIICLLL